MRKTKKYSNNSTDAWRNERVIYYHT